MQDSLKKFGNFQDNPGTSFEDLDQLTKLKVQLGVDLKKLKEEANSLVRSSGNIELKNTEVMREIEKSLSEIA